MTRVFISYSHADETWKDRVVRQLGVLADEGLGTWDDRRIAGGDDWFPEIEKAIDDCDVALLLISDWFLTSKFIKESEVPALLQRRQEQGIQVIPVILSPCQWQRVAWLKPIQARPKDGADLEGMTERDAKAALSALVGEIHGLAEKQAPKHKPGTLVPPDQIDLTHLPEGAPHFLGRKKELAALDTLWNDTGRSAIVQIIAPGGVGKTALVKRWLDGLRGIGWQGARRVYGWSFYSQGTREDRLASEDLFLASALKWFGVQVEASLNPWDKGRALAAAVVASRTLLLLDGVEPLQYPPGPLAGELRAPGLKALLLHLATAGQPGLCVISSRERLTDLDEYEGDGHEACVHRLDLGNLSEADGARLLHELGVKRAGAAVIDADDTELKDASREMQGHTLTLSLLGRYLALAYEGDIRKRDQVDFQEADTETTSGHAFKVMRAYETWFAGEGEQGARELAALRLLGYFDRPASWESLDALRVAPAIEGLTEPLLNLSTAQWRTTLKRLQDAGLIYPHSGAGTASLPSHTEGGAGGEETTPASSNAPLDAHPLIREYLARRLQEQKPEAWREGHRRLYEQLKASAPYRPEGLAALQPLYQAVAHGCIAGLYEEALYKVYEDRILRGTVDGHFYSWKELGAFGANLVAIACFFLEPWRQPTSALIEADQGWLLNEAAFSLRALGRLDEALEPMRAGAEVALKLDRWKQATQGYCNLSQLQMGLGRVGAAVADAEHALDYAERSGNAFWLMVSSTALADAKHQYGEIEAAAALFKKAETMRKELEPEYPLLYSLEGFRYCDILLAGAEQAAWQTMSKSGRVSCRRSNPIPGYGDRNDISGYAAVTERAAQTLKWAEDNRLSLLTIALDHLSLARCTLYTSLLQRQPPDAAEQETSIAVSGLRAAGRQDYLPLGLITRAWLRHCLNDKTGARADLDEVERIARRGNMRLHLADFHLHYARLFPEDDAWDHLAQARALIEQCGYFRRLPELEDAEAWQTRT